MDERPEQRPEGRLIAVAQKRARLSGREAARRAGMSEGHWRAIVSGSRSISSGVWVPVNGPAETLAHMAQAVGVTPTELRAAGRGDAADALEDLRELARPSTSDDDAELDELIEEAKVRRNRGDSTLYDTLMAVKRMNEARRQVHVSDARVDRGSQESG